MPLRQVGRSDAVVATAGKVRFALLGQLDEDGSWLGCATS
jgi:hypothetical protein